MHERSYAWRGGGEHCGTPAQAAAKETGSSVVCLAQAQKEKGRVRVKSSKGKKEERRPRRLDHQGGSFSRFELFLSFNTYYGGIIYDQIRQQHSSTFVYLVSSIIVMIYDLNSTKTMFAINSLQDVTPH